MCYDFKGGGFGGKKESGQLRFGGRDKPFVKPINLMDEKELKHQFENKKSHLNFWAELLLEKLFDGIELN